MKLVILIDYYVQKSLFSSCLMQSHKGDNLFNCRWRKNTEFNMKKFLPELVRAQSTMEGSYSYGNHYKPT